MVDAGKAPDLATKRRTSLLVLWSRYIKNLEIRSFNSKKVHNEYSGVAKEARRNDTINTLKALLGGGFFCYLYVLGFCESSNQNI